MITNKKLEIRVKNFKEELSNLEIYIRNEGHDEEAMKHHYISDDDLIKFFK